MHDNASSLSNFMPYRSPMNKTMTITVIALVAVVMVMGAVVPAMADPPDETEGCDKFREKAKIPIGKTPITSPCNPGPPDP